MAARERERELDTDGIAVAGQAMAAHPHLATADAVTGQATAEFRRRGSTRSDVDWLHERLELVR